MDQEQQRYDRAHARVQALKGFYIHTSAYVLVNIALFAINVLVGGGWWFYWPLLGWGIGLGVHALAVFGFSGGGPWGREWEERKTREFMDRDRGSTLRASVNRSWPTGRSGFPAVADPAFPDETPHDDDHVRERHPEIDHPPAPLCAPHKMR